ncbi:IS630 family transposase [Geochorda subterranea]|uniref:IS630 family transposase n=1 Tax=Geochorda subterranea TaxID=3109564 RepID=A0ABZ1BLK1_9FIRM|nr:IS630 family transposase [Limnochorda sp. LNt]WRP13707.1 IS630 family transposase [Limnochorda sp. LNt]
MAMRSADPVSWPLPELTADQRKALREWKFGQKVEHRLWLRASIIWGLFHHRSSVARVAACVGVTERTVRKWRDRFLEAGVAGLYDRPRSGRPPRFGPEQRCEVIALACDAPANYGFEGQTLWTYDTLTDAVRRTLGLPMSRSSIWRTLEQNALRPHRVRMWLHSPDPDFKPKVNRIVGLYRDPPDDAVILCIDEKTGMQALERKHETRRAIPGRPGRCEYEYIRHGTQSLLAAFDIRTGHVTARCGPTRTAEDLVSLLEAVAEAYREAARIIVIWDNLNIHHDGPQARWSRFNARHGGKFEFVYTPRHASWVNQVEIFFSILQRRCLKHGDFHSAEELRERVLAFIARWNTEEGHPFHWTFRGYPMQERAVA